MSASKAPENMKTAIELIASLAFSILIFAVCWLIYWN